MFPTIVVDENARIPEARRPIKPIRRSRELSIMGKERISVTRPTSVSPSMTSSRKLALPAQIHVSLDKKPVRAP